MRHSRHQSAFFCRTAIAVAVAILASALPHGASAQQQCASRGFLSDTDPNGTNLRAAPDRNARIVGRLPPTESISNVDSLAAEFEIVGSSNGWLRIRNPERDDPEEGRTKKLTFSGWIWGGLVSMTAGDARLRSAPREDAPVLAWLMNRDKGWGPDSFAIRQVHGCSGIFVDVTVEPAAERGKVMRGWIGHFCTNQLTTCDYTYPDGVTIPPTAKYPE